MEREEIKRLEAKKELGMALSAREEALLELYSGKRDVKCHVVRSMKELNDLNANVGDKAIYIVDKGRTQEFVLSELGWCFVGEEVAKEGSAAVSYGDGVKFRGVALDEKKVVYGYLSKRRNTEERPALLRYCIDQEEKGVMVSYIVDPSTITQLVGKDTYGNELYLGDEVDCKISGKRCVVDVVGDAVRLVTLDGKNVYKFSEVASFELVAKFLC